MIQNENGKRKSKKVIKIENHFKQERRQIAVFQQIRNAEFDAINIWLLLLSTAQNRWTLNKHFDWYYTNRFICSFRWNEWKIKLQCNVFLCSLSLSLFSRFYVLIYRSVSIQWNCRASVDLFQVCVCVGKSVVTIDSSEICMYQHI